VAEWGAFKVARGRLIDGLKRPRILMHTLKVRTRFNLLGEAWLAARDQFLAATQLPQQLDSRAVEAQLHATILEMVGACITLFERGNYWPVPVLLRVAHEALADQFVLERDPNYLKDMVATTLDEGRSLPEHINQQQRGLLQSFLAEPGAGARSLAIHGLNAASASFR
jgi:hypothetical protein